MSCQSRSTFKRRIEKLEEAAGKGQKHCPYCRLHHRPFPPGGPARAAPEPGDMLTARCDLCGSQCQVSLKGMPDSEREMLRLKYSFTMEERFTNPKGIAVAWWWHLKSPRGRPARSFQMDRIRQRAKKDRGARLYVELTEEVSRLTARNFDQLRAKCGRFLYEILETLDSTAKRASGVKGAGGLVPRLAEMEKEERVYLILAELEKIARGEALPETMAALEEVRRRISDAVEAAQQEEIRRKEELRRHAREASRRANQTPRPPAQGSTGRKHDADAPAHSEEDAELLNDPRFQRARVEE